MQNQLHGSVSKLLLARSATGEEWPMNIEIWMPEPSDLAPWSCKVEVTNLFSPPRSIYGEDSWQAQVLAMQFAAKLVQDFVNRGGKLFWPSPSGNDERQEFKVEDLLPQFQECQSMPAASAHRAA